MRTRLVVYRDDEALEQYLSKLTEKMEFSLRSIHENGTKIFMKWDGTEQIICLHGLREDQLRKYTVDQVTVQEELTWRENWPACLTILQRCLTSNTQVDVFDEYGELYEDQSAFSGSRWR